MMIRWVMMVMVVSGFAFAELRWDKTELVFQPDYGVSQVAGSYTFFNNGREAVTIKTIKPSCGCTTVSLPKMHYAPKESGTIATRMSIDPGGGQRSKTILVTYETPSGGEQTKVLVITSKTAELAHMDRRLLIWLQNGALEAQTITVDMLSEKPVTIKSVDVVTTNVGSVSGGEKATFNVALVPDGPKRYKLNVTPTSTANALSARLTITLDYPVGNPAQYYAYVRVTAPMPQPQ